MTTSLYGILLYLPYAGDSVGKKRNVWCDVLYQGLWIAYLGHHGSGVFLAFFFSLKLLRCMKLDTLLEMLGTINGI